MSRFIDADALLNRMKQDPLFPLVDRYGVSGVIEAEPTVDAVGWKSPIDTFTEDVQTALEGEVIKAVQRVGINVDRDELLKALAYDREQYEKGFADGRAFRDAEIVRCKECAWYDEKRPYAKGHALYECRNLERFLPPYFFCKDAVRRNDEQIH